MTKPATKDGAWCEFCQRFHASETCFEPGKKPMTEYERQYPLLKKRIEKLEAERMEWVFDRLPPEDEHVLMFFSHGGLCPISIGYYDSVAGWFEIYGDTAELVDANPDGWMPLPRIGKMVVSDD